MTEAFHYQANYAAGQPPSHGASIALRPAPGPRGMLAAYQQQDTPGPYDTQTIVDAATPGGCESVSPVLKPLHQNNIYTRQTTPFLERKVHRRCN
jgi:hypothetical protein